MKNHRYYYVRFLIILSIVFFGFGCNSENIEQSEIEVTIAFFDAIYNKKDLNKAITLSSQNFKGEIEKYKTARNFARRLLNLAFDSVEVEAQISKTQIIEKVNIKAKVTVLLTGNRNGRTYKDVKKILLLKEGNTWVVDKILDK